MNEIIDDINIRIRKLRSSEGLKQIEFGEKLGKDKAWDLQFRKWKDEGKGKWFKINNFTI